MDSIIVSGKYKDDVTICHVYICAEQNMEIFLQIFRDGFIDCFTDKYSAYVTFSL